MKLHLGAEGNLRDMIIVYGLSPVCKAIAEMITERVKIEGVSNEYKANCEEAAELFTSLSKLDIIKDVI